MFKNTIKKAKTLTKFTIFKKTRNFIPLNSQFQTKKKFSKNYNTHHKQHLQRLLEKNRQSSEPGTLKYILTIIAFGLLGLGIGVWEQKKRVEIKRFEKFKSKKEQFLEFADLTDPVAMSLDAFVNSIITPRAKLPWWTAYPRKNGKLLVEQIHSDDPELKLMLQLIDSDSDGTISLAEYSFFLTLLSSDERNYQIAFNMFDEDRSGFISFDEFKNIMLSNSNLDISNNQQLKKLFTQGDLSLEKFCEFFEGMKNIMLKQEFNHFDLEGQGQISVEGFSQLIVSSMHFNSIRKIPEFKRKLNLMKTQGKLKPSGRITLETFLSFNNMSSHIEDIAQAIKVYTRTGRSLQREDFQRAVEIGTGVFLGETTTDLVYALFDTNENGDLEYEDFIEIMKKRTERSYNIAEE